MSERVTWENYPRWKAEQQAKGRRRQELLDAFRAVCDDPNCGFVLHYPLTDQVRLDTVRFYEHMMGKRVLREDWEP